MSEAIVKNDSRSASPRESARDAEGFMPVAFAEGEAIHVRDDPAWEVADLVRSGAVRLLTFHGRQPGLRTVEVQVCGEPLGIVGLRDRWHGWLAGPGERMVEYPPQVQVCGWVGERRLEAEILGLRARVQCEGLTLVGRWEVSTGSRHPLWMLGGLVSDLTRDMTDSERAVWTTADQLLRCAMGGSQ